VVIKQSEAAVLLPFAATAASVAALPFVLAVVDRLVQRMARDSTPHAVLRAGRGVARIRGGSLEQALPACQGAGEGTDAQRAELWLAVEDKLVSAASYPPLAAPAGDQAGNAATGPCRPEAERRPALWPPGGVAGAAGHRPRGPGTGRPVLRAVLAIGKPGRPVTPADLRLMQDVANGAGMLLRGVQLNAELEERVRRAAELAAELQASRNGLTQARDVERRRLISELGNATTGPLATLRADLAVAERALTEPDEDEAAADAEATARDSAKGSDDSSDTDTDDSDSEDEDSDEDELSGAEAAQRASSSPGPVGRAAGPVPGDRPGRVPGGAARTRAYGALDELATDLPRSVR